MKHNLPRKEVCIKPGMVQTAVRQAVLGVVVVLLVAGCAGGSGEPESSESGSAKSGSVSVTESATPSVLAAADPVPGRADPAGRSVPLRGGAGLRMEWFYADGADRDSAATLVARRALALSDLRRRPGLWPREAVFRKAARAVLTGRSLAGTLELVPGLDSGSVRGTMKYLVGPTRVDKSGTARLFVCVNGEGLKGFYRQKGMGPMVLIEFRNEGGVLRADVNGFPEYKLSTGIDDFFKACQEPDAFK